MKRYVSEMSDERMVRLLEEIRDTTREHLGLYREGLRNQAESIAMQKAMQEAAQKRLRFVPWLLGIVLFLIALVLGMIIRIVMRYR